MRDETVSLPSFELCRATLRRHCRRDDLPGYGGRVFQTRDVPRSQATLALNEIRLVCTGDAIEDSLRWAQLSRTCSGAGKQNAGRAFAFPESTVGPDWK